MLIESSVLWSGKEKNNSLLPTSLWATLKNEVVATYKLLLMLRIRFFESIPINLTQKKDWVSSGTNTSISSAAPWACLNTLQQLTFCYLQYLLGMYPAAILHKLSLRGSNKKYSCHTSWKTCRGYTERWITVLWLTNTIWATYLSLIHSDLQICVTQFLFRIQITQDLNVLSRVYFKIFI